MTVINAKVGLCENFRNFSASSREVLIGVARSEGSALNYELTKNFHELSITGLILWNTVQLSVLSTTTCWVQKTEREMEFIIIVRMTLFGTNQI